MELRSKEYVEFLEVEKKAKQHTFYEKLCKFSEKFSINPPQDLAKQYQEAIDFCHLKITPNGAFSFTILTGLITFFAPLILSILTGAFSIGTALFFFVIAILIFYYLYDYPLHLSTTYRINASAEMVLAILYMTIAMRISPNIERAVKFASINLTGPLAFDLRKLLWDVYTRKYDSMTSALDFFIKKWKRENEEFTQSVYLIETSIFESTAKREKALDEALAVMLNGTKERMKHYAQDLKTPIEVINALGILLPIIGLIFFPIIGLFMPDAIKPVVLVIGYNFFLPLTVFWIMKTYLEKRPYSFHQPDISRHTKFAHEKFFNRTFATSVAVSLPLMAFGMYQISKITEVFSFGLLMYSLLISIGISAGIVIYSIYSVKQKIKLRDEIVEIENEFAEVLFELGNALSRGIPIETALKNTTRKVKDMKISKMFEIILHNIETFGMTFEQAVFDKTYGALQQYPSKTIEAVMRAVTDISRGGTEVASKAMISISNYLKDVHTEEEYLREMLAETTSSMEIQSILLAPLSSGVVVALAAIMMKMLLSLQQVIDKTFKTLSGYGPAGSAGSGILTSLINLDKMIPAHYFQLIVSIYMFEVVGMLAVFLSIIKNGDESLLKRMTLGKMMLTSTVIYAVVLILVYSVFSALVSMTELV